ncbi:MAG: hypothetical protein AAFY71_02300 [Bacteroidota bacterium]
MKKILFLFCLPLLMLACQDEQASSERIVDPPIQKAKSLPVEEENIQEESPQVYAVFTSDIGFIVSDSLMRALTRKKKISEPDSALFQEFYKQVKGTSVEKGESYLIEINTEKVDFDANGRKEYMIQFVKPFGNIELAIMESYNGNWNCIFFEELAHHYHGVDIELVKGYRGRTFLKSNYLELRGTGIYKSCFYYFQLVDHDFKLVMPITQTSYISTWGLYINHELSSVHTYDRTRNQFEVITEYEYYLNPQMNEGLGIQGDSLLLITEGVEKNTFQWNRQEGYFEPRHPDEQKVNKLRLLESMSNDSLFYLVFKDELHRQAQLSDTLRAGIAQRFLSMMKEKKGAHSTEGELELRGETAGGLKFYGPKDN